MGCLFRFLLLIFAFCIALVLLVFGGTWLLGRFAPEQAAKYVERRTGFVADFDKVQFNPFTGVLRLDGARIDNPPQFPGRELLVLEAFRVDFDVPSLRTQEWRFAEVHIDLERMGFVEPRGAPSNWDVFLERLPVRRGGTPGVQEAAGDERTGPRAYRIDRLYIRVGELAIYPPENLPGVTPQPRIVRLDRVVEERNVTDIRPVLESLAEDMRVAGAEGPDRILRDRGIFRESDAEDILEGLRRIFGGSPGDEPSANGGGGGLPGN